MAKKSMLMRQRHREAAVKRYSKKRAELKKGGPEWMVFVQTLLEGNDAAARKVALQQLTARGFIEKSREKSRLIDIILKFLQKGSSDEKRAALKFVSDNLALFPKDDDTFRSKILALQRERDMQLSNAATALLP